jgi:uncharacterized membrane protein YraQ (UPF0718 family)/copper chaperone CopZ
MREIFELINSMSPYLLLGFTLAGLMHAFVPRMVYSRYLSSNSFCSVLNAAILGIPLPLCSCGVIPTAMSLRKEGASKGATISFLIATPQTGVDSIIATYSLMGLPFAMLRPFAAFVTALFSGALTNSFDKKNDAVHGEATGKVCCSKEDEITFLQKIKSATNYAYVEMMQDIGRWLVLGLVVAGLITVFVPDSFFSLFADMPFASMLMVLLFAVPMYLCATGSIPIAVALMLKGLSPGTALVLLMAGPAVNVASLLVIGKVMGRKSLVIYLLSIVGCAILFGLGIDYLLPREWFTAELEQIHSCHNCAEISYFNTVCTVILALLLVNALLQRYRKKKDCTCSCQTCSTATLEFAVKGMNCNHCKSNVEAAIMNVAGVDGVEIDLTTGRTVIHGNPNKEDVVKAVEALGFTVLFD